MARIIASLYGLVCYLVGFGGLAYAMAFINDVVVPGTMNAGTSPSLAVALLVDVALVVLFGVQHSLMARGSFKRALSRVLPDWAERSLYVLLSGAAFIVLYVFWQPLPGFVWHVEAPALRLLLFGVQALGWALLVAATFMLDHLELFGLSQVRARLQGRAPDASSFRTPGLYRFVRHPIQLGVLIAFWATPDMTLGHLVFAASMTLYIVLALRWFEEPDLVAAFGDDYLAYRERVGMLLPRLRRA